MRYANVARVAIASLVLAHTVAAAARSTEPPIVITGSARMLPLLQELRRSYVELHPDVKIEIRGGGSGDGMMELARDKSLIAAVARPVSADEIRRVRTRHGVSPVGFPIAMDAVVLFVSPDNGLGSLTIEQIDRIYGHQVDQWEELGIPFKKPISRHVLGPDSGSIKVLQTRAMKGRGYTTAKTEHVFTREVVDAVAADPYALGMGGMGFASGVEIVPVQLEEDSEPIFPTPETVRSRRYPLAHYLYLYFVGQPKGHAKDFLGFAISAEGQAIVQESATGAVTLPISGSE